MKNTTCLGAMILAATSVCLAGGPSSDFDDGTLQGWTPGPNYGGNLINVNTGNPGGAMLGQDTTPGGILLARAPGEYSGNFNTVTMVRWDEYLPASAILATRIGIQGPDGTIWLSSRPAVENDVWRTHEQTFDDPGQWTQFSGSASFETVRANVTAMFIDLEVSTFFTEARIDNVQLIPVTCDEDLDSDADVDSGDLAVLLAAWGQSDSPADLNGDNIVNAGDLAALLAAWGGCDGVAVCGDGSCDPGEDAASCPADCLQVDPPANDLCADSIEIGLGTTAYTTLGAETDGPAHGADGCQFDGQTYNDVWFDFIAPTSGVLTVSTCNDAEYDTDLVVYAGCDCETMVFAGCSDDGCGLYSLLSIDVAEGECYKIRLGGWNQADQGNGRVTLSMADPECGNAVCEPGENAENCPGDCPGTTSCGAGAGSCDVANGTPGCDDVACCEAVCGFDPFCCDTAWDELCVDLVGKVCEG